MTVTDKIIFFAAIVLFWRGWNKGILRTIFGPVALVVCSIASYFYYILTRDLMAAAAIGIAAPIILNILFSILLNLLSGGKEKMTGLTLVSRTIAGLLNLMWGEFIIIVVVMTVWMIPFDFPLLVKAKADIQNSSVYLFAKPKLDQLLKDHNVQPIDPAKLNALSNPDLIKDIEKSDEYQELFNDPRIQALLTDPEITEQIENKQLAQLMQNEKFIALTRDPELLKKFIALYSKMMGQSPPQQ